jgi:hypothetical protein
MSNGYIKGRVVNVVKFRQELGLFIFFKSIQICLLKKDVEHFFNLIKDLIGFSTLYKLSNYSSAYDFIEMNNFIKI